MAQVYYQHNMIPRYKLVYYSISRSIWSSELIQLYAVANILAINAVKAKANEDICSDYYSIAILVGKANLDAKISWLPMLFNVAMMPALVLTMLLGFIISSCSMHAVTDVIVGITSYFNVCFG